MGKFDHIPNMLLQNARKGQIFSICRKICDLENEELKTDQLNDIERYYNGKKYNFTDGIGTCSPEIAQQIAR